MKILDRRFVLNSKDMKSFIELSNRYCCYFFDRSCHFPISIISNRSVTLPMRQVAHDLPITYTCEVDRVVMSSFVQIQRQNTPKNTVFAFFLDQHTKFSETAGSIASLVLLLLMPLIINVILYDILIHQRLHANSFLKNFNEKTKHRRLEKLKKMNRIIF